MKKILLLPLAVLLVIGACAPVQQNISSAQNTRLKSAAFTVSDLTIVPESISVGDASTIGVTVTNTGETTGTYQVKLKVNNDIAETQNVTLAGGDSQVVTFIFNPANMRDYMIAIDQLEGVVRVSCEVPQL